MIYKLIRLIPIIAIVFVTNSWGQLTRFMDLYPGERHSVESIFYTDTTLFYFSLINYDSGFKELWKSDGSIDGTYKITDFDQIKSSTTSFQPNYISYNGNFYLFAVSTDRTQFGLWEINMVSDNVELVYQGVSSYYPIFKVNGSLWFVMYPDGEFSGSCEVLFELRNDEIIKRNPEDTCFSTTQKGSIFSLDNTVFFPKGFIGYYAIKDNSVVDIWKESELDIPNGDRVDVQDHYIIPFNEKIIFHGYIDKYNSANNEYGVYAFDPETYELIQLVDSPNRDPKVGNRRELPFIVHDELLYFTTTDESSLNDNSDPNSPPLNNVLYRSDGTVEGTERLFEFKESGTNGYNYPVADIVLEGIVNNKIILYGNLDTEISTGEYYSYDIITGTAELVYDLGDKNYFPFAHMSGRHTDLLLFTGKLQDTPLNANVLFVSDGTAENLLSYPTLIDDSNYNIIGNGGIAILDSSKYYLVATLKDEYVNDIYMFDANCDGGDCGSSVSNENESYINEYKLSQNYPNPFNPSTTIRFGVLQASKVRLDVFNMLGQKIKTLVNENKASGFYTVTFDATNLSSGVYIYRIQAGDFVSTKKMLLIK